MYSFTLQGRYACVPICVVTLLTRFLLGCVSVNELNVFFPIDDELKSAHIKSAKKEKKVKREM